MKPYYLVAYNRIRLWFIKLKGGKIKADGVQMFSQETVFTLSKDSIVKIGDRFVSDGCVVIFADRNASIEIGERVYCNRGTMISSKASVQIGSGCRFGPNVIVIDNNHKYDAEHGVSSEHTAAPIRIGKNCWIGANTVVLKGTIIGDNCVIGAGCVVSGSIPPSSVVSQNRDLTIKPMSV